MTDNALHYVYQSSNPVDGSPTIFRIDPSAALGSFARLLSLTGEITPNATTEALARQNLRAMREAGFHL